MPLPLPRPPLQVKQDNIQEDKSKSTMDKGQSVEEKLAKGLCRKCGKKWFRNHKCADSVQLNVIQEVWDLIEANSARGATNRSDNADEECFMALSEAAIAGEEVPRTLKLS
jgi:hypothetical protein